MKIGLIDNDLVYRTNHNFPNLAIMKLSGFHKSKGDIVELIGFNEIDPTSLFGNDFDIIYVSKAFTDSYTPEYILKQGNVKIGGTGFYFDKAESLPSNIEHHMPDYSIYHKAEKLIKNKTFFTDYSIGYTTRGCFRHCDFCVNKNSNKVLLHSPIDEFYDDKRKKIALLDDNILGLTDKELFKIFDRFEEIAKPIQYRQGMDIRLLSEERIKRLLKLKYDGNYIFAFDDIKYKDIISKKLELMKNSMFNLKPDRKWIRTRLYVLCCFDKKNIYDLDFWENDIINLFNRIKIILDYKALPYIMRYEKHKESPFYSLYMDVKEWANNTNMIIWSCTFNEYLDSKKSNSNIIRDKYPNLRKLFDIKLL